MGIAGALVTGAAGVAHFDKSIELAIDGQRAAVHSFGSTVGDVLDSRGISVGAHDLVLPSLDSRVSDGQQIVVRYGRLLTVTVDGVKKEYWTTATNVGDALAELGLRADNAQLSASRSTTLGRSGLTLRINMPKSVTVTHNGKRLGAYGTDVRSVQLAPGPNELLFESPACYSEKVSLPAESASEEVRVRLRWKPALLLVRARSGRLTPSDAVDVVVDGRLVGRAGQVMAIPVGGDEGQQSVSVQVSAQNHHSVTRTTQIRANQLLTIEVGHRRNAVLIRVRLFDDCDSRHCFPLPES